MPALIERSNTLGPSNGVGTLTVLVLDTNVVLDCFLFEDPGSQPLRAALQGGEVRWIATEAMLSELMHVVGRGFGSRWSGRDINALTERFAQLASTVDEAPPSQLHCTDPDDQMFIDLALAQRAPWLLTRDRALLKLARRARLRGVEIVSPRRWHEKKAAGAALCR